MKLKKINKALASIMTGIFMLPCASNIHALDLKANVDSLKNYLYDTKENLEISSIDWTKAYKEPEKQSTTASDAKVLLATAGVVAVGKLVGDNAGKIVDLVIDGADYACAATKLCGGEKVKGFKPLSQATALLEDIKNGVSERAVYGQEEAKSQFCPIMLRSLEKIEEAKSDKSNKNTKGNVVYIIGSPGTGKTELVKATAEAILKHPTETFLKIDPSMINTKTSLDDQLFKTLYQEENVGSRSRTSSNIYDYKGRSKILAGLQNYGGEMIIFIDDYEKMKEKSSPSARTATTYRYCNENECEVVEGPCKDKTADETLKQIAENGGYWIGKTWVSCDKAIIFVATNENLDEIESSFGIDGVKGGGIQRLGGSNNIIQFKNLDFQTCRKIVIDIINKLREKFTNPLGNYKLTSLLVDDETIDNLASIMENNKQLQGRLKEPIETAISFLFADCINGQYKGKSFSISYANKEGAPLQASNFNRTEINPSFSKIPGFKNEKIVSLPYNGKNIPAVTDVPVCKTCKSLIVSFPELKGKTFSSYWTSFDKLQENVDKSIATIIDKIPAEIKNETIKKIHALLFREASAKSYINKDCIFITINIKGNHQNYITLSFAKKNLLKRSGEDVYYINCNT